MTGRVWAGQRFQVFFMVTLQEGEAKEREESGGKVRKCHDIFDVSAHERSGMQIRMSGFVGWL